MSDKKFDVLGIGNAVVDIICYKDEEFLVANQLAKGSMTLIDKEQSENLYKKLSAATECSGGSAANTIAGFSLLGGEGAFHGKVKNDYLGQVFQKEIEKANVKFLTESGEAGFSTAKCIIFVTEEETKLGKTIVERTMATYLDWELIIDDIDIKEEEIKSSKVIYFEGYLFDTEAGKRAIQKAIKIAEENNVKIAFTLSDSLCVERHKIEFLEVIENHADIIFGNNDEMATLYDDDDVRKILHRIVGKNKIFCITRSENGSYIIDNDKVYDIPAEKVDDIYDVTGAGDLYAAGFLYGYTQGWDVEKSGRLASLCAADVIQHIGGRPVYDLSKLVNKAEES